MGSAALGSPERAGFARPWVREQALCPGEGVFILNVSHVRLFKQVDLVRARSVLITPALPDLAPTRAKRVLRAC